MMFRSEGCVVPALLAPFAIAACGSSGVAGSRPEPEAASESAAPSDASVSAEIQSAGVDVTLPSATAFADVNIEADFSQPVDLPPPATAIAGDTASLVGSWDQLAPGGSVCTPATARGPVSGECFHLDIQKDDAGVVEGTIHADPPPPGVGSNGTAIGPFPPPTDPNVGYPPDVSPSDYSNVAQFAPNVDYRLLDGVVTNGSFTFWFSPIDLWSAWCALQTPYVWNVNGAIKYRCVPQSATPANTDLGKFDLCTSPDDGPQCTNARGAYPCACVNESGVFSFSSPGCLGTVCECSATQCRADLRSGQRSATLTLEGGNLVGSFQATSAGIFPNSPVTFQRATQ